MNCEIVKMLKTDSDTYNVICIEQDGVFDYYLQKVGFGDLMYIFGLEKAIDLPEYFIIQHIDIAIKNNFWME